MLKRLQALDKPIEVIIVGAGAMGEGLFYQCHTTLGLKVNVLCDLDLNKCIACAEENSVSYSIVSDYYELWDTIQRGELAICQDGNLAASAPGDVFIESTNTIREGVEFCLTAIENELHLVMMNAEVDLAFGPLLLKKCQDNELTYTSCDGDQHCVLKRIIDDITLWGFDVRMAGNIKGFLDTYSNPTKIIPEADKRSLDYKMATAYTDGTKLHIEMALLANALGYLPNGPHMTGPRLSHAKDTLEHFNFQQYDPALKDLYNANRLLTGAPVVDYILGSQPDGGVFVVGYCDNAYQKRMMKYYKMGSGPFYVFYRPYHLCHVEAVECIVSAVLDGESLLQPDQGYLTNVFAYAKKDLEKGQTLDGLGGYTCYGLIESVRDQEPSQIINNTGDGLPICLAENVVLNKDISKDSRIRLQDVNLDVSSPVFDLYQKACML